MKIDKKSIKILQNRVLELSWRGLGAILDISGPRRPQDTTKGSEMGELSPPHENQIVDQNRSMIDFKAIQRVIIFRLFFESISRKVRIFSWTPKIETGRLI